MIDLTDRFVIDHPLEIISTGEHEDDVTAAAGGDQWRHERRDRKGEWTDTPGEGVLSSTLSKLKDFNELWKKRSDYVGHIVAVRSSSSGQPYSRLIVIDRPKGPTINVQMRNGNVTDAVEWWPPMVDDDIKSLKDLNYTPGKDKYEFIAPEQFKTSSSVLSVEKIVDLAPYTEQQLGDGVPKSEQINISVDDTPDGWSTGGNVITADVAHKLHMQRMAKYPWSGDQQSALNGYTGYADDINTELRRSHAKTRKNSGTSGVSGVDVHDARVVIDSSLYPAPRDITVFRQVTPNALGVSNLDDVKNLVGTTLQDHSYLSTSVSQQQNLHGAISDIQLKIDVPKGYKSAYIAGVSEYPEQSEFILKHGTKIKITQVDYKNGRVFVHAEVVS